MMWLAQRTYEVVTEINPHAEKAAALTGILFYVGGLVLLVGVIYLIIRAGVSSGIKSASRRHPARLARRSGDGNWPGVVDDE